MFALLRPARKRRQPSPRNLEIYEAVMLAGKTQEEVAAKHEVSQARVSQIVASVDAWRVSTAAVDRGELSPEANQRNEQWLARRRNHELYRRNIRAFDQSAQPLKTTKTVIEDGKEIRVETTVREQRPNASFLKGAQAANNELSRQAELPVKPEPKPEENYEKEHDLVDDWLWRQRRKREDEGKVARSAHPGCLVKNWLAVLLGDNPGVLSPGFAPPGPAVKELVRRFVLCRYQISGDQPGGEDLVEDVLGEPIGTNHPAYPGMEYPFPVVHENENAGAAMGHEVNHGALESAPNTAVVGCATHSHPDTADAWLEDPSISFNDSSAKPGASAAGSSTYLPPGDFSAPPDSRPKRLRRPGFSIAAMEAEILQERMKQHLKNMEFKRTGG